MSSPADFNAIAEAGAVGRLTTPEAKQWGLILHLSQLAGYVIPLAGLVAPIVIWQIKKNEIPELDAHGKMVTNWIISAVIYGLGGLVLSLVVIGFLVLLALGACCIVFPIIGGIKSQSGQFWKYPLTIPFIK